MLKLRSGEKSGLFFFLSFGGFFDDNDDYLERQTVSFFLKI